MEYDESVHTHDDLNEEIKKLMEVPRSIDHGHEAEPLALYE